jgi:hypothetical protein
MFIFHCLFTAYITSLVKIRNLNRFTVFYVYVGSASAVIPNYLLHFSLIICNVSSIMLEMDRILRPGGHVYIRDSLSIMDELLEIAKAIGWQATLCETRLRVHMQVIESWFVTSSYHAVDAIRLQTHVLGFWIDPCSCNGEFNKFMDSGGNQCYWFLTSYHKSWLGIVYHLTYAIFNLIIYYKVYGWAYIILFINV